MIRKATFDDVPGMLELGRRAHAASRFAHIPLDETETRMNVASVLTNKRQCAFVSEVDGKIVGVLIGISMPWFFATRQPYATDLITYAERRGDGLRLMRRFMKWAFEERKVSSIEANISFGGDVKGMRRTQRLYSRLGFRRVGANFFLQRGEP